MASTAENIDKPINVITPSEYDVPLFPNPKGVTKAYELLRSANTASLSTLDPESGYPLCSLVNIAASFDGSPLLYISNLSLHTRNIIESKKVSLLISPSARSDLPRTARISLVGDAVQVDHVAYNERFKVYNPVYASYPSVGGFFTFKVEILGIHFVDGAGGPSSLEIDSILSRDIEKRVLLRPSAGSAPIKISPISAFSEIIEANGICPNSVASLMSVDPDGVLLSIAGEPRFLKVDCSHMYAEWNKSAQS
ncbi:CREG family protein [Brucella pseudogrignonensis]|uniref:CREG family protein n=1 Tax=Brucella pseudogrignonensis TaxID=419475 RepID=UPI001E2C8F09|nr:CREG family protein [Brucella pseudogrignonensis]MCD4511956.1 CREG family protein [Brucella pseudogrignonensis]